MAPGKQPPKPPPLAGALRAARSGAPILFGVAVIAVAIWYGARQGHERANNAGFGPSTTARAPAQVPFASDQDAASKLSDKDAFAHSCGTCHTLRAADVVGVIGPDLDRAGRKLTFTRVREQIRTGSLDSAMPANLLVGKDADRVARYVARVAR
jgi:mono/diheme cytochrome c family protein